MPSQPLGEGPSGCFQPTPPWRWLRSQPLSEPPTAPLSSASGLWQLVNPKPPAGAQERFEKPANYWQQQYNDCFDKLGGVGNLELRKHIAGMLAHWLNNAHHVDQAPGAQKLQDIKVPLIIAQYLNGPSLLHRTAERPLRIVTQAGAVGENPPPRIYVA